jgi:ABC-type bacteriocin/lantibiotic exporter with double-glycine peptidase domain
MPRQPFLAPEIIQISNMDCGPASLKCLLRAVGLNVRYEPLRDLCQTEVDGTSIDMMEEVAIQLGAQAAQGILPVEHISGAVMPAILVVTLPSGEMHFAVLWRQHGPMIQMMDPAIGRVWIRARTLGERSFRATYALPHEMWRALAFDRTLFLDPLAARLARLGVEPQASSAILDHAREDPRGGRLAALDAGLRMTEGLAAAGALRRGAAASALVERLLRDAASIPPSYFFARLGASDEDGVPVSGAVLLMVAPPAPGAPPPEQAASSAEIATSPAAGEGGGVRLSAEDAARLTGPELRPIRELWRVIGESGWSSAAAVVLLALLGAIGVVAQALVFRSLIDLWRQLGNIELRAAAVIGTLGVLVLLYLIELTFQRAARRVGRDAEIRLRAAFLDKLGRLGDRYLRSRALSDLADRAHRVHEVQLIPVMCAQLIYTAAQLASITAILILLDPEAAPIVIAMVMVAILVPWLLRRPLEEAKLRAARHNATLGRFFLDALFGAVPVRAHGGERALRREHEGQLGAWSNAFLGHQRVAIAAEVVQLLLGYGLAAWLILVQFEPRADRGALLLVVFWALRIPSLGQEIALFARLYPGMLACLVRILEPLQSLEHENASPVATAAASPEPDIDPIGRVLARTETRVRRLPSASDEDAFADARWVVDHLRPAIADGEPPAGASIQFDDVVLRSSGTTLLDGIRLSVEPGEQLAIVGASGAGKSSLIGLLLGLDQPTRGVLRVDGRALVDDWLDQVRGATAWLDPQIRLWNTTVIDNLRYGNVLSPQAVGSIVRGGDLLGCVERLDEGLQTSLGDGGARLSGGEGQRVRFGRALGRWLARLVLLDEPFRGLDRDHRRMLVARARAYWASATMLVVSHDVSDTRDFDRVVVIDSGRIVEDGAPGRLLAEDGAYRALVDADERARRLVWGQRSWTRLRLGDETALRRAR